MATIELAQGLGIREPQRKTRGSGTFLGFERQELTKIGNDVGGAINAFADLQQSFAAGRNMISQGGALIDQARAMRRDAIERERKRNKQLGADMSANIASIGASGITLGGSFMDAMLGGELETSRDIERERSVAMEVASKTEAAGRKMIKRGKRRKRFGALGAVANLAGLGSVTDLLTGGE